MKKRRWMRRSGMLLSAFLSMAAPAKAENTGGSKNPKPCKKSKSPAHQMADDDEAANSRPPQSRAPRAAGGGQTQQRIADLRRQLYKLPVSGISKYPWKVDIATTVFWIGEKPTESNPTPQSVLVQRECPKDELVVRDRC